MKMTCHRCYMIVQMHKYRNKIYTSVPHNANQMRCSCVTQIIRREYLNLKWISAIQNKVTRHYLHYSDVIMGAIASQINSLAIIYPTVYSDADQRKHQSSASLAFVRGIHRGRVTSPHKWPVTRKMFPFDDAIMHDYTPLYAKQVMFSLVCALYGYHPILFLR